MLEWKKQDTGRVLELKGARQVGKTYILKKFGKENFSKMIYVNMADTSRQNFLQCISMALEWKPGEPRPEHPLQKALLLYDQAFTDDKDTVVIIDEIQESAQVYNQIRTFAREFQAYVIVTGSYLGKATQSEFFLPAGDIDHLIMETLTFDEFLDVFGERELYETIDLFGQGQAADYEKLMGYYDIYQKIGGYPAVVVSYAKENNAIALLMMQEKQGVRDLTSELSKIAYQEESGRTTKKMINHAISWLQESHIVGYASKAVDCDYKQIKDNSRYYFLDMGIAYYFLSRTGAPKEVING